MRFYVIAATENGLWLINPKTGNKENFRTKVETTRILDFCLDETGVYHAEHIIESLVKPRFLLPDKKTMIESVRVVDSLKSNPIVTIHLAERPGEERDLTTKVDFDFRTEEESLVYYLNNNKHILYHHASPISIPPSGLTSLVEGRLFVEGKPIGDLKEPILKIAEVDAAKLIHALQLKNKLRYQYWRNVLISI